jgi:hypothetical protein
VSGIARLHVRRGGGRSQYLHRDLHLASRILIVYTPLSSFCENSPELFSPQIFSLPRRREQRGHTGDQSIPTGLCQTHQ